MARSARIEAALVDLKGLAASAVIVHLLAMLRPAVGVGRRLIFQVRVVGCDGDSGAVLINFDYSCFLDFLQSCFHVLDCGRMCYNGKKRRQPACGGMLPSFLLGYMKTPPVVRLSSICRKRKYVRGDFNFRMLIFHRIKAMLAACKPLIRLEFHRSYKGTPRALLLKYESIRIGSCV